MRLELEVDEGGRVQQVEERLDDALAEARAGVEEAAWGRGAARAVRRRVEHDVRDQLARALAGLHGPAAQDQGVAVPSTSQHKAAHAGLP